MTYSDDIFQISSTNIPFAAELLSQQQLLHCCLSSGIKYRQPFQSGRLNHGYDTIIAKMQGNDVDTEYMQKGNTQGTVSSESLVNGRPVHERQEDPEELTSGDFQSAAGGISVSCPAQLISKSICCPHSKGGCSSAGSDSV